MGVTFVNIDIATRMITLIGTPLGQSFAAPSFAGCAVTKPNKVKVLQYLDALDPLCAKMGACNTVVKDEDGRLVGYNTDGMGFLRSLTEEADFEFNGSTIFCLGAGGAGRALCCISAHAGARRVYVADVDVESGRSLVRDINNRFAPVAEFVSAGDYSKLAECDLIVNATGIGMGATVGRSPLPPEQMVPGGFYYDTCYNPAKTQFLLDAEARGGRVMNGLGMSLYQGIVQIELWTGQDAPVEVMRRELMDILAEGE